MAKRKIRKRNSRKPLGVINPFLMSKFFKRKKTNKRRKSKRRRKQK